MARFVERQTGPLFLALALKRTSSWAIAGRRRPCPHLSLREAPATKQPSGIIALACAGFAMTQPIRIRPRKRQPAVLRSDPGRSAVRFLHFDRGYRIDEKPANRAKKIDRRRDRENQLPVFGGSACNH